MQNLLTISGQTARTLFARDATRAGVWPREEVIAAVTGLSVALTMAFVVWWFVRRLPWPRPFRLRFVLIHLAAAPAVGVVWFLVGKAVEALATEPSVEVRFGRLVELVVIGIFLYVFVAGITYATEASARAARAEAITANTQLAALRAQIHPHFLFNALHTVVQLIPVDPARAAEAAQLVADLLRSAIEEQRDEVTLDDEWRFISRYLAVEQIRFGSRLTVTSDIAPELLEERVPSFALQSLVENAVRHGAAPRVAPTEIVVTAVGGANDLTLSVKNTGDAQPAQPATNEAGTGTGLARLRERLAVLYGDAARLVCGPLERGGFEAVLVIPRPRVQPS